jgi:hypothetical protein
LNSLKIRIKICLGISSFKFYPRIEGNGTGSGVQI